MLKRLSKLGNKQIGQFQTVRSVRKEVTWYSRVGGKIAGLVQANLKTDQKVSGGFDINYLEDGKEFATQRIDLRAFGYSE